MFTRSLWESTLRRWRDGSVIALILVSLMIFPTSGFHSTAEAASSNYGRLVVVISGTRNREPSVCLTLRDLTNNFVVGSYCDNDDIDQDARVGRMVIELPRREFAVSARATGCQVLHVTPTRFVLTTRQTLHIKLANRPN